MDPENLTKRIVSGVLAVPAGAYAVLGLLTGNLPLPSITGTIDITGQPLLLGVVASALIASALLVNALGPSRSRAKSVTVRAAVVGAFLLMGAAVLAA